MFNLIILYLFYIINQKKIINYQVSNIFNLIYLSASFKGYKKNSDLIKKEMLEFKEKKEKSQPTRIKTSGSTFKNPVKNQIKKFGS